MWFASQAKQTEDPLVMVFAELRAIPGGNHVVPPEVVQTLQILQSEYGITVVVDDTFGAFWCDCSAQRNALRSSQHRSGSFC